MSENLKKKLHFLRQEYGNTPLLETEIKENPFEQFVLWFDQAVEASVFEPNAMVLATVSPECRPSTRTVLLKEFDERGLIFFSGLKSRKADQLSLNPYVSVTFWWKEIYRQVHFEGKVEKIAKKQVLTYFASRPRGAQIAVWAAKQSEPLVSRDALDIAFHKVEKKFERNKIPFPTYFGGYRLVPERIEFWQGRQNRLHDRIVYICVNGNWMISRLAP